MKVEIGQVWRHKPSGDVRTVLAVVRYRERTGFDPGEIEKAYGIEKIAVMSVTDRRDSSDMQLAPDGSPFFRMSWELVSDHSGCEGERK